VKYPDFKNKVPKEALWIDNAPIVVLEKVDDLVSGNSYIGRRRDIPFDDITKKGIAQLSVFSASVNNMVYKIK
jgi:hypothetical protein